jgi:hypothetical protein
VLLIGWGELTPHPPNLGGLFGWDKLEHFTAYFGLASMATMVLGGQGQTGLGDPGHHSVQRRAGNSAGLYRT